MNDSNNTTMKVEIYKLANRLKSRLGIAFKDQENGFLAPELIDEADKIIKALCVDCPETIGKHLETLGSLWAKMKEMPASPERNELGRQIFTLSHEIKDVSLMCEYELLSHFAESLRDYIGQTEMNIEAQVVIVQAHLDVMNIVHKKGFKRDAGPEAEELMKIVRKAIEKYH